MTKLSIPVLACLLIAAPGCGDDGQSALPDAAENIDAGDDTDNVDGGDDTGDIDAGDDTGDIDAGDDTGDIDAGDDTGDIDAGDNTDVEPTAFRITTLELVDPHARLGCGDVTTIFNNQLTAAINEDGDGDEFLDLSGLAVFRPLDQGATQTPVDVIVGADCTVPADTTTCAGNAMQSVVSSTAENDAAATCSVVVLDSTNPDYDPTPSASATPCFSAAAPGSLILEVSGTQIELVDVAASATYDGDPATGLSNGVLRGFISEAQANNVVLSTDFGDFTLSSLFLGGEDNTCADGDDRDTGPGDESGWYIYLAFTAQEVPYSE